MRHIEGEESVLLALLTLRPCPETTLCLSSIDDHFQTVYWKIFGLKIDGFFLLQAMLFIKKAEVSENLSIDHFSQVLCTTEVGETNFFETETRLRPE